MRTSTTPNRSSGSQRQPASEAQLYDLLKELVIVPAGHIDFELISEWAAKHVWRIDVNGKPWAFIRHLLGPASHYPNRWRHLRLGQLLHSEGIGPKILGLTPDSRALGGRAAIVEESLFAITRDELEERAPEAMSLFTALHSNRAVYHELAHNLSEADIMAYYSLATYYDETHERWYHAVAHRWHEAGLSRLMTYLLAVVEVVFQELADIRRRTGRIGLVVPTHGDPNHGNFMVNADGELRMIDFEELALNNPVADLGVFLTWYVDRDEHYQLLHDHYLVAPAAGILARMHIWVPLRYLNIAAHWAARLIRAKDDDAWKFAAASVQEWLGGACELIAGSDIPDDLSELLAAVNEGLLEMGPLV